MSLSDWVTQVIVELDSNRVMLVLGGMREIGELVHGSTESLASLNSTYYLTYRRGVARYWTVRFRGLGCFVAHVLCAGHQRWW